MSRWLLANVYFSKNSALEHDLDSIVLKSAAYGSKEKDKASGSVSYLYVAVPFDYDCAEDEKLKEFASAHCPLQTGHDSETVITVNSLYRFFSGVESSKFTVDVAKTFDDDDIDVFYSDGSSNRKEGTAAYAMCAILGESANPTDPVDEFTNRHVSYEAYSGKIDVGTNNIGELSGIKAAIAHAGDKEIQVIISDSEYSIKAFREWMYNWIANNYKGANGKRILNEKLIKSIIKSLQNSDKIWLFKWTKGHANNPLNEICDHLAKGQIGIE